jgi:hypothetical protein
VVGDQLFKFFLQSDVAQRISLKIEDYFYTNVNFDIESIYDLKIIQKAGKETFSEKWSWIYFSFCYFAFHVFNTPHHPSVWKILIAVIFHRVPKK